MSNILKSKIKNATTGLVLTKKEIKLVISRLSLCFKGYPLFEYFTDNKYDEKKMEVFWKINLKTISDKTIFVSSDENMSSIAVFSPYQEKEFSVFRYFLAGGFILPFKIGFKTVRRMSYFEKFALKVKKKYMHENCWYFYTFVTLPELRGKGIGSKVIKEVIKYLDEYKQDCYLETLLPINVTIYKKYGFELKEEVQVPKTNLTIYAMVRKAR